MSYQVRESEHNYNTLRVSKSFGLPANRERRRTATARIDHNDKAVQDDVAFSDVPANVTGPIGRISSIEPTSGQSFVYSIESGSDAGHFTIDNQGYLHRAAEATLVGPYALVCKAQEGNPLRRAFTVAVAVTTAA